VNVFRSHTLQPKEFVMAQAIVNPEELRRFAQVLKRFNGDIRDAIAALQAQLSALGDTWRDQEHDRFRLEFEQTLQVVERFLEASDEHVPFLMHKAQHIEDYLHQR
jgi:uncharacterized protein YukE